MYVQLHKVYKNAINIISNILLIQSRLLHSLTNEYYNRSKQQLNYANN